MKNILVIHQSSELYGSDKMLLLLLSGLDKSIFRPVVILPDRGPLITELEQAGIKVVVAPVLKVYRNIFKPKNILRFFSDMRKAMSVVESLYKEHNFDIVYSNTLAVLLGVFFAKKKKIRHVWHVHEIIVHPQIIANIYPKLLKKFADTIICNSCATMQNLIKRIPSLEYKCVVVHNGISIPDYEAENTSEMIYSKEDVVITLVGRISRLKGHKLLLNIFSNYLQDTKVKLLFVGSAVPGQEYYLAELEDIIRERKISSRVKIISFTRNLAPIWDATDIAIMPSTEAESFGLVALEAMLAKKPVIAANHGGLTEILVDNETGYLIEPCNEEAFANAIKKLAGNEELRTKFGESGQNRAKYCFSVENYVLQISNILNA